MKKLQEQTGKLSLKKFQISKIKNPETIVGGQVVIIVSECRGGDSGGMGTQM